VVLYHQCTTFWKALGSHENQWWTQISYEKRRHCGCLNEVPRTVHNLRISGDEHPTFCLDKTWVQNNSKNSSRKGSLRVPPGKWSRFIVCMKDQQKQALFVRKWIFRSCPQMRDSDYADIHNFRFLMYDTWFQCVFVADNKFKDRILLSHTVFKNFQKTVF
jgi:hypothetical protein